MYYSSTHIYIYIKQKPSTCNRDVQLSLVQVINGHFQHHVRETGASPVSQNWVKPTEFTQYFPLVPLFQNTFSFYSDFTFCTRESLCFALHCHSWNNLPQQSFPDFSNGILIKKRAFTFLPLKPTLWLLD